MKEKLKEMAKNIFENPEGVIVVAGSLCMAYALGYKVGYKMNDLKLNNGLNEVFKAKPEIETLMLETIEELIKK